MRDHSVSQCSVVLTGCCSWQWSNFIIDYLLAFMQPFLYLLLLFLVVNFRYRNNLCKVRYFAYQETALRWRI